MNVASLELSRELYKLSGWKDASRADFWGDLHRANGEWAGTFLTDEAVELVAPAYGLSYLLRKMPASIPSEEYEGDDAKLWIRKDSDTYFAYYFSLGHADIRSDLGEHAATPEDAVAKVAIEIFRRGIRTRDM